ncbi:peptidase M23 [Geomonas silvestris]|uniref:Peptidase M23 n=1 Tax=Geomonas silvestris TaxID=2740184 RepID=A0A6V8MQ98_9BACT|nr:M23 family metallopeptidase [Geomonas silvestris]GFO62037.1 peptidase M23 [Geomonas silvestris]
MPNFAAHEHNGGIYRGRPLATALLAACCFLLPAAACADFYKYTDDDGVETYTNTPTSSGGVRVMRETKPAPASKASLKRKFHVQAPAQAQPEQVTEHSLPTLQESTLPVQGVLTSKVGWRHDPIDGTLRHHNGIDIAVPPGTQVKAIAAGKVIESASHGGYGNLVRVQHDDGSISSYGHNSRLDVAVGERVTAGQTLALSGSTGRSTGPHVHFELWKNGANVTESYLNSGAGFTEVAGSIRTYLHSNGSIVFTNLN